MIVSPRSTISGWIAAHRFAEDAVRVSAKTGITMVHDQDKLPTTSLILLAGALILFGIGGGLVGYTAGERHGEQRAVTIIRALGAEWEARRLEASDRFDQATEDVAAGLEKSAAELKAQVAMYHGCGGICAAIANQFSDELIRAGDKLRTRELPPLPEWQDTIQRSGAAVEFGIAGDARIDAAFSRSTVITATALICATVVLCFGIACFTILRLRPIAM